MHNLALNNLTHHVTRKLDCDIGETTLSVPLAKIASTSKSSQVQLLVVGNEEIVFGIAAEALSAVPGHVLNRHERPVSQKDEVKHSVANDRTVVLLDDTREDAEARWRGCIVVEDAIATLVPCLYRSVDGTLHLGTVKVNRGAFGEITNASRETQHIPKQRACGGNLVDIPARVDQQRGFVDLFLYGYVRSILQYSRPLGSRGHLPIANIRSH